MLSGAIHYFRVHPEQWADRIRKARLMGLNTIETYVAWNAHEPRRGQWDASGANDLGRFLDLVAAEGLHAIVRPGPYICAEWHNGGLPVWLTGDPDISLRRSEAGYLAETTRYLERVYQIVAPRQIDRGGNVILVQIENEYGAYGSDKDYLAELVRVTRANGITVPLTTVDQPQPDMLRNGSLPGLHITGSFGSKAAERLATLREHQPTGPLMCSEFWDGWFDWWGGLHHTTTAEAAAHELDTLLAAGASVNIYMFHGGTNFGLTNGANDKGRYLPITTSYDYDAPLDEAGNPTAKFYAFREVIARYQSVPAEQPHAAPDAPALEFPLTRAASIPLHTPNGAAVTPIPPTFDDLGHLGALVTYAADIPPTAVSNGPAVLQFDEVRDMAWAWVDDIPIGTISRTRNESSLVISTSGRLTLLVEEQGRVNYDIRLGEPKGLIGTPRLDGNPLVGWTATPLDIDGLAQQGRARPLPTEPGTRSLAGPAVFRGEFELGDPADLFIDTTAWRRGYAFVNGFPLGRYSNAGPQRTLYVPEPVTWAGINDLVIVELDHLTDPIARFVPQPVLGPIEE